MVAVLFARLRLMGRRALSTAPLAVALAAGAFAVNGAARAQAAYPASPVKVIVPHPPGGPADVVARIAAAELTKGFGRTFYVENKPGGGGLVGAGQVARSAPDGETLLVNASTHVIAPSIFPKIDFDAIKDFTPLTQIIGVPLVLVVNPELPVHSVKELIAYARSHPGKLSFASAGSGGAQHLGGELFKQLAGVDMLHVPFRGGAPALTAVMGGQVQAMFESASTALPNVRAGKLRALAITSARRSPQEPELPTMIEAGVPGYELTNWYGLWAPRGLRPDVGERIVATLREAFQRPELQAQMRELGAEVVMSSPEDFGRFCVAEKNKWAAVVAKSNAKLD